MRPIAVGQIDEQNRILGDQTHEQDHADHGKQIERVIKNPQRRHAADNGERLRHHYHYWLNQGVKLTRQHHIDHDQCHAQCEQHITAGLGELFGLTGVGDGVAGRQDLGGDAVDRLGGRAERQVFERAINEAGILAIAALDLGGPQALLEFHQAVEAHQVTGFVFDMNALEAVDVDALTGLDLQAYVITLVVFLEVGDVDAAGENAQGLGNVSSSHAELRGAFAVQDHAHLWQIEFEILVEFGNALHLTEACDHVVGQSIDGGQVVADDGELQRFAALTADRRNDRRECLHPGDRAQVTAQLAHDVGLGQLAVLAFRQANEHPAGVHLPDLAQAHGRKITVYIRAIGQHCLHLR